MVVPAAGVASLRDRNIGDAGAAAIAEALKSNSELQELKYVLFAAKKREERRGGCTFIAIGFACSCAIFISSRLSLLCMYFWSLLCLWCAFFVLVSGLTALTKTRLAPKEQQRLQMR